ncbi:MAG: RpiB/LacA/LacB family sugar-phosphate isomerase [Patescibacteria group bacterium]|nr:RpiB/LacA/LacB family sugar-phosphate isomerase [Patescibacteria group bacterium]MDE1946119.1 RpiB/LacA/LacB family sugar-phosphate isomerase [Patescibacteria group bacterium]
MKHPRNLGVVSHKPKIYIGTDHAGFDLKNKLVPFIKSLGYEVADCGAYVYNPKDDDPVYVAPVARAVAENPEHAKGIILGGSGQGEAIVANRFPGVRAIVFYGNSGVFSKLDIIRLGREHNDSNVLSIGARFVGLSTAKAAVKKWLAIPFSNAARHIRRIKETEAVSREVRLSEHFK